MKCCKSVPKMLPSLVDAVQQQQQQSVDCSNSLNRLSDDVTVGRGYRSMPNIVPHSDQHASQDSSKHSLVRTRPPSVALDFSAVQVLFTVFYRFQGRRNGSGRPGGCRTNNLTSNNFYVHIISIFENVS